MATPINRKVLLRYAAINIAIVILLVFLRWYVEGTIHKGLLYYIDFLLFGPGILIVIYFRVLVPGHGLWWALHNYSDALNITISLLFYSLLIALIQVIIYKWTKRKRIGTINVENQSHR